MKLRMFFDFPLYGGVLVSSNFGFERWYSDRSVKEAERKYREEFCVVGRHIEKIYLNL